MPRRIRRGDTVVVMRGNHRGQRGQVLAVLNEKQRVIVEGVNMIKRHTKAQGTQQAAIVEREGSIALSNVMPVDPESDGPTRVTMRVDDEGKRVRTARKSGQDI